MRWTEVLKPEGILLDIQSITKEEALLEILKYGKRKKILPYDISRILDALLQREKMISTGVGHGIALPHAKCDFCTEFISLLGISKKGIDYEAADREPVYIISLLLGPRDQPNKNIKILARIARILDRAEIRNAMIKGNNAKEIYRLIEEEEKKIEKNL